jgi:hypothetical protein
VPAVAGVGSESARAEAKCQRAKAHQAEACIATSNLVVANVPFAALFANATLEVAGDQRPAFRPVLVHKLHY